MSAAEQALAQDVAQHKTAIRLHREQLRKKAAQLADLRRRCAELGIGVTVVAPRREQ